MAAVTTQGFGLNSLVAKESYDILTLAPSAGSK